MHNYIKGIIYTNGRVRDSRTTGQSHGLLHDLSQHSSAGCGPSCNAPLLSVGGGGARGRGRGWLWVLRLAQRGQHVEHVTATGTPLFENRVQLDGISCDFT